jgi:hypothetical protein
MAGLWNDCPRCQEHLAAGDVVIASIAVDHTQAVWARARSLAFLSLWFSADDMLLEKWHEPELLVDLAAPEIVDWQSWVVLRPRMSERTRSFLRYVFHQASRNTRLHRCFFQEFIGHVLTVEHPAIPICDCPGAALQIWKDQPDKLDSVALVSGSVTAQATPRERSVMQ